MNIVLPYGYRYELSMDINTPAIVDIDDRYFRLKVRHMATKIPGFLFSGYRTVAFFGESLMSMPDFEYILSKHYGANITTPNFKNS